MLSKNVEQALTKIFLDAKAKGHEHMTVEHLLLGLLNHDTESREILSSMGANVDELGLALEKHIDSTSKQIPTADNEIETAPTLEFQRALQRAVFNVQSSGRKEVTGGSLLVGIYSESDSQAVALLKSAGIDRIDIANKISHGIETVASDRPDRPSIKVGRLYQRLDVLEEKVDRLLQQTERLSKDIQMLVDRFDRGQ